MALVGVIMGSRTDEPLMQPALDTLQQIEAQLVMRHYDGFMRRSRIRGRRG